jgi:hypothetical protein
MRLRALLRRALLIVPVLCELPVAAQERPDLSGQWVFTSDRTAAAPSSQPSFGNAFTARQAADTLTIERAGAQGAPVSEVHKLDGSQSIVKRPNGETTFRTSWDGGRLVVLARNSSAREGGAPVVSESRTLLWLEAPDTLVVERVFYSPVQRPAVTSVYRRTDLPKDVAASGPKPAPGTITDVAWIAGEWVGAQGPLALEERWTPPAGGAMLAVSRTLKEKQLVAFEFLRIVERAGGLVYIAQPNGRPPTEFTLTKLEPGANAVFENPKHDYPKMIRYTKQADGSLEAQISAENGQRPQTFRFKRPAP